MRLLICSITGRRDVNRLAAEEIAGFRQVLIGMDDEHHVLGEDHVVIPGDNVAEVRSSRVPEP